MYAKYQGEKRVCVRACFEASKTKLLLFSSFRCSIVYLHTPFLTPSLPHSSLSKHGNTLIRLPIRIPKHHRLRWKPR